MMFAWMFSATLLALLLGTAAFAGERALRSARKAGRWAWTIALIAAITWPVIVGPLSRAIISRRAQPIQTAPQISQSMTAIVVDQLPSVTDVWLSRLDSALIVAWVIVSAFLLIRLLMAARNLRHLERGGRTENIDGESVLVTESLGPAVVGVLTPRIAVPEWLTQLDAPLRRLVLKHEREHCRTRDPHLIWLAAISVVLMPWNVGVWWMTRRLKLALEIDCDARTLVQERDNHLYGKLLLLIAQRQSETRLAPMLAESNSHLAQRIRAMKESGNNRPGLRVAFFGAIAAFAIALACSPRLATDLVAPRSVNPDVSKSESPGDVYFEFQVDQPVAFAMGSQSPKYPEALKTRGLSGEVLAQFVVGTTGAVEVSTFKVLKSSDSLFTQAIIQALPAMRFVPATKAGKPVKQLVQSPYLFDLNDAHRIRVQSVGVTRRDSVHRVVLAPDQIVPAFAGATRDTAAQRAAVVEAAKKGTYINFQIEQPASLKSGMTSVIYPAMLKSAGVEGDVLAQFIVDTAGVVVVSSFKVLESDNPEFTKAVRDALPDLRFEPARVGGRVVRQLMQSPFHFSLSR